MPAGKHADFVTLTFPASQAPDEDQAHAALRRLVLALRRRGYLGAYGWVEHRTKRGVIHYHAIMHLPWFDDDLAEWRALVTQAGFGPRNRIERAQPGHAAYCAKYISNRLAHLAPRRRAYGFSRDFPQSEYTLTKRRVAELLAELGAEPECEWVPAYYLR